MKIRPNEIGFDFDGVIADTTAAFIRLACEKYDYCSFTAEDITSFAVEECLNMPSSTVNRIFLDILEDSLGSGLEPMADAVEVITTMAAQTRVTVITARHLHQPVADWFDRFFAPRTRDAINLIAMGDHDDKLRYIQEHKLRYFVDDRAETCQLLAANEIQPLVYDQPWNRNRHNLRTVANWQEIRAMLHLPDEE